jgi:hypothetical protein
VNNKADTEKILERFVKLDNLGEQIRTSAKFPAFTFLPDKQTKMIVDTGGFARWRVACISLIASVVGSNDVYFHEFEAQYKESYINDTERGLGIIRALKEDIEGGYLQKVESLVSASVFTDFLDMAEHLLDNGYKDPAASLIGAVLGDGLRRICHSNSITVKSDDNIGSLNHKVFAKNVYNLLKRKEIEAWKKLRDYADHGHFGEYEPADVKAMLSGVRAFLSDYLK